MKTIEMKIQLTYDDDLMHGDCVDARNWFFDIIHGDDLILCDQGELGDVIGSVKVLTVEADNG